MARLGTLWISLKSSLWFVPALMILLAVGLAFGLVALDSYFSLQLERHWPRLFGVSAEGSRTMLSAIATSTITVTGATFSITIVTLSLAANQYTPRVLRNFMRDRANQIVLGGLVSVFVYCLLVLRTIRGGEEPFIPALAVMMALLLAVGGIALLIFFIHHIASSIQVSTMLEGIAQETTAAINTLFPEEVGTEEQELEGTEAEQALLQDRPWEPVPARATGYIQNIESSSLVQFAAEHQTVVKLEYRIGEFVAEGAPLVRLMTREKPAAKTIRQLNQMIGINSYRTIEQDPDFGIRQIADIAVKALSPGINDPTTAVGCLDYLGLILRLLVWRRIPSPFRYQDGHLRVIARGPTFELLLDLMLHEMRQHARDSFFVIRRMLEILEQAASPQLMPARRQCGWARHI